MKRTCPTVERTSLCILKQEGNEHSLFIEKGLNPGQLGVHNTHHILELKLDSRQNFTFRIQKKKSWCELRIHTFLTQQKCTHQKQKGQQNSSQHEFINQSSSKRLFPLSQKSNSKVYKEINEVDLISNVNNYSQISKKDFIFV